MDIQLMLRSTEADSTDDHRTDGMMSGNDLKMNKNKINELTYNLKYFNGCVSYGQLLCQITGSEETCFIFNFTKTQNSFSR